MTEEKEQEVNPQELLWHYCKACKCAYPLKRLEVRTNVYAWMVLDFQCHESYEVDPATCFTLENPPEVE